MNERSRRFLLWLAWSVAAYSQVASTEAVGQDSASQGLPAAANRVSQIIAHRGASTERPECTLAAIRRAIEVGATAVEVDVRTSRDGNLFILHDATLDRTTNGEGAASNLTLAELQQLADSGGAGASVRRGHQNAGFGVHRRTPG